MYDSLISIGKIAFPDETFSLNKFRRTKRVKKDYQATLFMLHVNTCRDTFSCTASEIVCLISLLQLLVAINCCLDRKCRYWKSGEFLLIMNALMHRCILYP
jgi:hypothetical protein